MTLVWALLRQNRAWILAYSIGTSVYVFFLAAVFPSIEGTGLIEAKLDSLPPELLDVFKIDPSLTMDNALNLLASNYYGIAFYIIATLFALTFASRLMAKPVDSGELMLYLAAPISRTTYVTSSLIVLVIASIGVVGLNGLALLAADGLFDLEMDWGIVWGLQLNAAMLLLTLGAFTFLLASVFDDSSRAYMVSGGVLFLFLVANIFSGFKQDYAWMGDVSVYSLFDANDVIQHGMSGVPILILIGLCVLAWLGGYVRFSRKDLTI